MTTVRPQARGQGRVRQIFPAFFSGFAVLTLVGIAGQFVLAGMSIFGVADGWGLHKLLGGLLALPVIGMLCLALTAHALHPFRRDAAILMVVYLLQVLLAALRGDIPAVASLHPLNALVFADVAMGIAKARFSYTR